MLVGLKKIEEATAQLIVLNEQLEVQKVVVAEKTLACELILQEISKGLFIIFLHRLNIFFKSLHFIFSQVLSIVCARGLCRTVHNT